jgi:hypothetical protein
LKFAQPQLEPVRDYLSTHIVDVTYQTNTIGYYLSMTAGNTLFRLDLGPTALALCKTPGPAELRQIAAMIEADPKGFAENYLKEQGV